MKKIVLLLTLACLITVNFTNGSTAKTKAYYNGDAISYQGQVIIASTNTGNLELFTLDGDQLNLVAKVVSNDTKYDIFYDVLLDQQWDRLFVYVTSGRYLYKYDATNLDNIILRNQIKDNSWDWFSEIDKVDGQIVTKGSKFIKVWDDSLRVVDSYALTNRTNPYNITFGYYNSNYIYNTINNQIDIFDRSQRKVIKSIELDYNERTGNRKLHPDAIDNFIYAIDDTAVKKYSHIGGFYNSYEHNSGHGYDVIYSTDGIGIYFSNGLTVQKINKGDFEQTAQFDNSSLGVDKGWAMGLTRVIDEDKNELVVVFNNSSILVLDNDLNKIAQVIATEVDDKPIITEKLWINIEKAEVTANDVIVVSGGGFAQNEELSINLETNTIKTMADNEGRFSADFRIPLMTIRENETELRKDIKVTGQLSKAHYSIGVIIKK